MKRAAAPRRFAAGDRSVLSSVPGIPGWAALLLLVVFFAIAWAIEWGDEFLGRPFTVLFFLGAVLAVLLVRRSAVFWAAVQPPLVAVVGVLLFQYFTAGGFSADLGRTEILTILVPLAKRFPLIIVTTIVVVAIALVRAYVLEPDRKPRNRGARAAAPSTGRGRRVGQAAGADERADGAGERAAGTTSRRAREQRADAQLSRSRGRAAGSAERPASRPASSAADSRAGDARTVDARGAEDLASGFHAADASSPAPRSEPVEILGSDVEPETTRFAAGRSAEPEREPEKPEPGRAVSAAEAARRAKGSRHSAGRKRRSGGGLFGRGKDDR